MGTNYYMFSKNKELVNKHFREDERRIVDEPDFGYMIHIGKRSYGWKPLFEAHRGAYSSVKELEAFINDNQESISIYDEYGDALTLDELKKEFFGWGNQQEKKMIHYDDKVGNIMSPIDHVEMARRDGWGTWRHWHDPDGNDFTEGEFS